MKTFALKILPREETGKGVARKLRRGGLIPAVIYGPKGTQGLSLDLKELQQVLKSDAGSNALLELNLNNEKRMALLKDIQYDPILQVPIHVDIFEVSMDRKIKVMVEVKSTGADPEGFKKGGILTHNMKEVEVECLPSEIPEFIEVDLSALDVGDSLHVSDLSGHAVKILTSGEQVLFTVVAPTVEEVAEPVEEGAEAAEETQAKPSEAEEKSEPKSGD